jgi:hypothetical protein
MSRTSGRSSTDGFHIEEELERFVTQIEDNTFAILSVRQKFALLKSNSSTFERETVEKLDSFQKQLDLIEHAVSSTFDGFNSRLTRMEQLAFRPASYHPSKVITIPDTHQITSLLYTSDLTYIGTDTSRLMVYSSENGIFINEFGPFDGTSVVQIGNPSKGDLQVFAVKTSSNIIHMLDFQRPTAKRVIESPLLAVWPPVFASPFPMATIEGDDVILYGEDLNPAKRLNIQTKRLTPGPNKLIALTNPTTIEVYDLTTLGKVQEFTIQDSVKLIASGDLCFVVSGDRSRIITVCHFSGAMRTVDVGGTTSFLFVWRLYYFRMGEDTLIEGRDFEGKQDPIKIGDPAWWPHASQTKLAACTISESCLVTGLDLKCVIWR